jgi:heavy metal sensor kinase
VTPRRLPIRWRLTLWYAGLLAVTLALFGGVLYLMLRQQLYTSFDEQLLNQASLTLTSVRFVDGRPVLEPATGNLPEGEYFLRLLDAAGVPVFATGAPRVGVPLSEETVTAGLTGETTYSTARDDDGDALRVVSVPVVASAAEPGAVAGILQVGLDRNEIDEPLALFLSALVLATPLALLLAGGSGYLLAGRALAPVAAITKLAARIGARDLGSRLDLDLPDDELGRLARTFNAMLARIDDAFERQRRFTGDAAHELRTPLSLLQTRFDLALARRRTNDEYREALHEAQTDLARLTGLVNTLLTLARADSGQLPLDRSPFDLATTVAAVCEQYAPCATAAGVILHREDRPTPLAADEDRLLQVLVNLLDNALAHTPAGGTISVGCRCEAGMARLWVADSGDGIALEHLAHIFERFYRIDIGRTNARGGTGLGLAICQAIAQAHGGTIAVSSQVGTGTRVALSLPSAECS